MEAIKCPNCGSEKVKELTEEKYPWVRVIALAENTGFCKAVNIGIEATQTPYF